MLVLALKFSRNTTPGRPQWPATGVTSSPCGDGGTNPSKRKRRQDCCLAGIEEDEALYKMFY
jgi:hypothetical protein